MCTVFTAKYIVAKQYNNYGVSGKIILSLISDNSTASNTDYPFDKEKGALLVTKNMEDTANWLMKKRKRRSTHNRLR